MQNTSLATLPRSKRVAAIALLVATGILLGFLLRPDDDWQTYLRWVLATAGTLAFSWIAPTFYSFPETVDEYRRYRPKLALLVGGVIGVTSGITVFILRDDTVFAVLSGIFLAAWLSVAMIAGTWIARRVTNRGKANRSNDPSGAGLLESSYQDRTSAAVRRRAASRNRHPAHLEDANGSE